MKFLSIFAILFAALLLVNSSKIQRTETSVSTETKTELPQVVIDTAKKAIIAGLKAAGKAIAQQTCDYIKNL